MGLAGPAAGDIAEASWLAAQRDRFLCAYFRVAWDPQWGERTHRGRMRFPRASRWVRRLAHAPRNPVRTREVWMWATEVPEPRNWGACEGKELDRVLRAQVSRAQDSQVAPHVRGEAPAWTSADWAGELAQFSPEVLQVSQSLPWTLGKRTYCGFASRVFFRPSPGCLGSKPWAEDWVKVCYGTKPPHSLGFGKGDTGQKENI